MQAIKRILHYLASATNSGLYYPSRQTSTFAPFSDSDWASCSQARKSQTGVLFTINNVPVHWISIKQPTISLSHTEAEYVAGGHAGRDVTWFITHLRARYVPSLSPICFRIDDKPTRDVTGIILPQTIALGIDNKIAIDMARFEGPTKLIKHIDVNHHSLQQQVASNAFRLQQISTTDQMAEFLTKPLQRILFQRACKLLHLTDLHTRRSVADTNKNIKQIVKPTSRRRAHEHSEHYRSHTPTYSHYLSAAVARYCPQPLVYSHH
jgi:hypothetical protein